MTQQQINKFEKLTDAMLSLEEANKLVNIAEELLHKELLVIQTKASQAMTQKEKDTLLLEEKTLYENYQKALKEIELFIKETTHID